MPNASRTIGCALAIVLLYACICPEHVSAQGWEWQNPTPHGYPVNDVFMLDESTAFAVCDNGIVMRSIEGGRNWWSRPITLDNLRRVVAFPDGNVVVLGDNERVYHSRDLGVAWDTVFDGGIRISGSCDLAVIGDSTVIAFLSGPLLLRSTDRGNSWARLPFIPYVGSPLSSFCVQSPTTWFVFGSNKMLRSTNAGQTWQVDTKYAARGLQRLVFVDSLYGYQARDGQLLRTYDGGRTWTEMDIYGFDTNIDVCAGKALGNVVYCLSSGDYIVNASTDGGETWNISLTGIAFRDTYPSSISFASARTGLVAGDGGRILLTTDGGAAWTIVHGAGYLGGISDLVFTSQKNGIALTYASTVLVTSNGGRRWDEVVPDPDYSLRQVSMFDDHEGYAYGFDAQFASALFATTDVGRSWTVRSVLPLHYDVFQSVMPSGLLAVSRDTIFVGVENGSLLRTFDGGAHWDSVLVSNAFESQYTVGRWLFWFPPRTLLFTGSSGLARSDDAGSTWIYHPTTFSEYFNHPNFFSPDVGFGLFSGKVGKTTNGGITWEYNRGAGFAPALFFDENRGIGLSATTQSGDYSQGSVLRTTSDGGHTWTDHPMKERIDYMEWFFLTPEEGWGYGYSGMIRHTTSGGIVAAEPVASVPLSISLDPPYPNPFVSTSSIPLTVSFSLPPGTHACSVAVYDALGRSVAVLVAGRLDGGRHFTSFHQGTNRLSTGMYYIRLSMDAESVVRRFLVLD